jgi:hypothetical protein
MTGEDKTLEPLVACGARSCPKLGSFQSAQKLTRGKAELEPAGRYWPL